MADAFLSQEEIDALLEGVTGESQKLAKEDTPSGGVRDYNLQSQERIVRGRMPTMEIVNERFSRNLRLGLFNFIRRSPEISVGAVQVDVVDVLGRSVWSREAVGRVELPVLAAGVYGVRVETEGRVLTVRWTVVR